MTATGLSFDVPWTGDPDPTLPYAGDYDAIETVGSLALLEPAHSASPFAGVPVPGDMLPNILWERLSDARVGAGLAAATAANSGFTRKRGDGAAGGADAATKLITERSGKGGLHGIYSQTNNPSANGISLTLWGGSDLKGYLDTVYGSHQFYFSVWDCVTRIAAGSTNHAEGGIYYSTTNNMLYWMYSQNMGGNLGLGQSQVPASPAAATGNRFRAAGISAPFGTNGNDNVVPFSVGQFGPFYGGAYGNMAASRILYRYYLEDLTVSGRTFAQVQAIDYAQWLEAFGAGGRYAGDTYTAPAI